MSFFEVIDVRGICGEWCKAEMDENGEFDDGRERELGKRGETGKI